MEINIGLILATIINTGILYAILRYFFFGKVKAIIEQREAYINERLENAEEANRKAEEITLHNTKMIEQVKYDSKRITEEEVKKAERIYKEIIEDAKIEAIEIKEKARIEIEKEREKAEKILKKQSVDLAVQLAEKLMEKNIDESNNKDLVDDFISELGE